MCEREREREEEEEEEELLKNLFDSWLFSYTLCKTYLLFFVILFIVDTDVIELSSSDEMENYSSEPNGMYW